MSKELEALKVIYNSQDIQGGYDEFWKAYRIIEKSIKALEIIKEKRMIWFDYLFKVNTYKQYNKALLVYYDYDEEIVKQFYLNEGEFGLLKKVFDNE